MIKWIFMDLNWTKSEDPNIWTRGEFTATVEDDKIVISMFDEYENQSYSLTIDLNSIAIESTNSEVHNYSWPDWLIKRAINNCISILQDRGNW